jgi:serine/threonine protein kinase
VEKRLLEGRFGVYRLGSLLERTSWCNVYRAYRVQRSLFHARETFAAKEVFLDFPDPHLRRIALDEFNEHAAHYLGLAHPALARVVDFLVSGPCHYTLFEYVPGRRLGLLLDRQDHPTPEELVVSLAVEVVRGLRYIHGRGLVFGDLSPSSIIITPQGHARLTDFGLSRHLVRPQPGDPLLGTRGYAPPEQYGAEARLTPGCDLYALGALLWRCLTLGDPARHDRLPPLPELNPAVTPWMADLVGRLVDPVSSRRPTHIEEVWEMLVARDPSLEGELRGGLVKGLLSLLPSISRKGGNGDLRSD